MHTKKVIVSIFILIAITAVGIWGYWSRLEYTKIITALESISPQQVTAVRIYPRVSYSPSGTPLIFNASEPIIADFFQALKDRHSYPTSRDRVDSQDHCWFLEIAEEDTLIQMAFYIPSQKGEIVVGTFGKFGKKGAQYYYRDFQSRQLYHWYQKYSHRWLEPKQSK